MDEAVQKQLEVIMDILREHRQALLGLSVASMELKGELVDLGSALEMMAAQLNPEEPSEVVDAEPAEEAPVEEAPVV